ncbi:TIM barrel protein [Phytoactinopolyspora halotolerans]|uniref:TIM barrel protein n=1 Tax=Phytoactinopolyspora halotolerans TaxID=1981512 RepID=A0A6L9SFM9_9ACTN|nr:TIM barrel protein [Phytoactinopolyspora halotolerans]
MPAVEILWWRNKDLERLSAALTQTGIDLQTMGVDPIISLVDPASHDSFITALEQSAQAAHNLNCPYLVISAGEVLDDATRPVQHQAVADVLHRAVPVLEPTGRTLLLENLNSRVDHVGTYLDSTAECLDIVDEVNSPRVKVLYDLYHSITMGERPEQVLDGRVDRVAHVQIADTPGRHEPGTGTIDWASELTTLRKLGYEGRIGLEYIPTTETPRSFAYIRSVIADLG